MSFLKFTRKKIVFIVSVIIIILLINSIASFVIENKITEVLLKNESKYYTARVEASHFKLLRRSLVLNNISLIPKQEILDSLKQETSQKEKLEEIRLSSIEFNGIGIFNILFNNKIHIKTLEINDLYIKTIQGEEIQKTHKEKKALNLDSIYIKKLKGLQIDNIAVNDFVYEVVDVNTNEVMFKNEPLNFASSGFKLEEVSEHLFKILPVKESFELSKIELKMNAIKYDFSIENIAFNFKKRLVDVKKISLKPQVSKYKLAKSYDFCNDVYDLEIDEFKIFNFNLAKLLNNEGIFIDSVQISGLDIELYKDKRRPFNTNKYNSLPHIALQKKELPLHIAKLKVANSVVLIEEHLAKRDSLMVVTLNNIDAIVQNITSIESLRENPMLVDLTADLMNEAPLKLHVNFPLKNNSYRFSFNGSLGASKLKLYDSALFPAIGLKVLSGDLNSMVFSATANNISSNGRMTMLYDNLSADVFKANSFEENKFLTWTVNSVIKKSNPNKYNKTRVAAMEFERDTYKGLGNYIWKTILSGITNSIAPGGKQIKPHKKRRKNKR